MAQEYRAFDFFRIGGNTSDQRGPASLNGSPNDVNFTSAVERFQELSQKYFLWVAAPQAAEKRTFSVIPGEARNLSFFVFLQLNRREIPRFARNDRIKYFFRSLFSRDIE